jgi:hypothetical protein
MLGFRGFCRETLSAAVMKFRHPERCQRLGQRTVRVGTAKDLKEAGLLKTSSTSPGKV